MWVLSQFPPSMWKEVMTTDKLPVRWSLEIHEELLSPNKRSTKKPVGSIMPSSKLLVKTLLATVAFLYLLNFKAV
jgi:hypothetical protein